MKQYLKRFIYYWEDGSTTKVWAYNYEDAFGRLSRDKKRKLRAIFPSSQ